MNEQRDILDVTAPAADGIPPENRPVRPESRPRPGTDGVAQEQDDGSYFLNKFLEDKAEAKAAEAAAEPRGNGHEDIVEASDAEAETIKERIVEALKEIYDPEIPVNIYELGLIYDVKLREDHAAFVTMTLTTPHCPVAESMPAEVELKVNGVEGVNGAEVRLVWDPPWDMNRMSDEARLELGLL
ncbi:SUF system Fe-S cluster assembly protein [Yunchengibacter salinarum]|uniref:SUF system Fe-S cluster assembly protein n=1 Tax=Yunchengibacter salinarum TaxID=3133399 RepID=UPI0035B64273